MTTLTKNGESEVAWRDMSSAPKDGTMLRLLVRPGTSEDDGWTPFANSIDPYATIGFNALSDTMEDEWQFAGWDWSHDCFTDGAGEVIGWLPFDSRPTERVVTEAARFKLGDRVTKLKGSSWTGRVVGFYSTSLTPIGYAVESENEPGSVQNYPEAALASALAVPEVAAP